MSALEILSGEGRALQHQDKVALITGAGRGIGLATARRFLAEGWQVALLDVDGETLKAAAAELDQPDRTLAVTCDVADPDEVAAARFAASAVRNVGWGEAA